MLVWTQSGEEGTGYRRCVDWLDLAGGAGYFEAGWEGYLSLYDSKEEALQIASIGTDKLEHQRQGHRSKPEDA